MKSFKIIKLRNFLKKHSRKILYFIFSAVIIFLGSFSFIRWLKMRNETVAIVNGYCITIDDILTKAESIPQLYRDYFKTEPKLLIDEYINQVLLFQQAKKYEKKYQKEIKRKLKNYYIDLLTSIYVEKELAKNIKISEKEIEDYYNKNLNDFIIPEKVHLYEIVTDSKEKAQNILYRLSMGESFEEIAEKESISDSAKNGGDLGWIELEKLEPEVASLVSKIKPGQILANVFETDLGYHIIKLAGKTERRILTLEEAKGSIINILQTQKKKQMISSLLKQLREKSKIQIIENKMEILKERI